MPGDGGAVAQVTADFTRDGLMTKLRRGFRIAGHVAASLVVVLLASNGAAAEKAEYRLRDPALEVVRIDSSPRESFLSMRADASGRLFVGGREAVFVYEPDADSEAGGLGKRREIFRFPADSWVYDLEIRGNDLYAMTNRALYLLPGAVTKRTGVQAKRLVWGHPDYHPHQCFHGLAWGPDGYLYLSLGDMLVFYGDFRRPDHWGHWTFFCQPEGTRVPYTGVGGVLRCLPDGSDLQVVARGTRNSCGLVFDSRWNLFTHDNDHEGLPLDYVPGRLLHVTPGADFGWPRGWMPRKTPDRADLLKTMLADMGRGIPVGQTYYDEPGLPEAYRGNLLLARWGRRAVTRYEVRRQGATFQATEHVVLEGLDTARPVGVAVGRGGNIFVTLAYMAHNEGSPVYRSDLLMIRSRDRSGGRKFRGIDLMRVNPERLFAELDSGASWPARRAYVELLRRGPAAVRGVVRRLMASTADRPEYPHLVWLAAHSARHGWVDAAAALSHLVKLAGDRQSLARPVVVRALAEYFADELGLAATWDGLLEDRDPRVQHFAVIAQARRRFPSLDRIAAGPAQSSDTYIRQTAFQLLARKASLKALGGWAGSDNHKLRLAAVLAIGTRLTIPPAVGSLRPGMPLGGWPSDKVYKVTYVGETVDLRQLGRVGVFSTADHWAAGKRTSEQETLFALLVARLKDPSEAVRLQAAHFLSLTRDARSEPLVEVVRVESQQQRLKRAPIRGISELWVAGPFADREAGFETVHPPETRAVDLAGTYKSDGRTIKWSKLKSSRMFDFHKRYGDTDGASCYAYLRLISPRRQQVLITPGSDDGLKVWVNGTVVHEHDTVRGGLPLQDVIFAELQPGSNELLFRVRNVLGEHCLYLHYRSLGGSVQPTLPEPLDAGGLAARLKEAVRGGKQKVGAKFLAVDWAAEVTRGDKARGAKLFAASGIGCAKCHAARGLAAVPGAPSLVGAGRRFTVPYLVESVLLPNRKVSPVFRSTVIVTNSGKTVTGLVVGETGQALTVLTSEAKRVEIPRAEIETRKTQNVSSMPPGLVKTPAELRDLIAYLLSQ